ncbi:hypothetical protein HX798_20595 [Pseudomonas putida]|uniref:Uncharacterized protein n=1 Tax=Pseudomonas putida TaxID=303 RepID=A0A7Y8D4N6_PSEPU|nr:hypothetical protein [Pseudomonas putida]NWC82668.1 hypothetical protein [Pseudomonas putida]
MAIRNWWTSLRQRDEHGGLMPEDLLPEFERYHELIDGETYVVAAREKNGALNIFSHQPTYSLKADAWRFPGGGLHPRREPDVWITAVEWPDALDRAWERQYSRTCFVLIA